MYKSLVLMLIMISFLFTGCQSKTPVVNSNSAQSNSEQEPPLEIAYTVEPVAFQENIPLQKREEIIILDATESSVLFSVYVNNAELGKMKSLPSYTDRICIYNIADKQTQIIKKFDTNTLYFEGKLLQNMNTVFCTLQRVEGQATNKFTVYKKNNNEEKVIDSGFCEPTPTYSPDFVKLDNGEVAYSYIKYENDSKQNYGINKINQDDSLSSILMKKESDVNRFIVTDIVSNGTDILLFHETNGKGEFVNYSFKNGMETQFSLPSNKKMMSYCLLKDSVLFCFQNADGANELFVKPLNSNEYIRFKRKDYYQLYTNNMDNALAIGPSFGVEIIKYDDTQKKLDTKKLEIPLEIDPEQVLHESIVRIIPINQHSFFLHYEKHGVLLKLILTK